MDREMVLRNIADEILSLDGQRKIEDLLACDELKAATLFLLGALDAKVSDKKVEVNRAKELYSMLGVDPEYASMLRARNNSF